MDSNWKCTIVAICGICTSACLAAPIASAALVTPTLNWEAQLDGTANSDWESSINQTGNNTEWSFDTGVNTPGTSGPASNFSGITELYSFPGARARMSTFQNGKPGGNLTNADVTFELIFRPTDFLGKHVLFETGGNGDGLAFTLDGSTMNFVVQDGNNAATRIIAPYVFAAGDVGLFHQFVATVDVSAIAGANEVLLYHNGAMVTGPFSAPGVLQDWAGGNGSGLGRANGGLPLGNSGYANFDGDIAALRYYANSRLTANDVLDNYRYVNVPEPSALWLLGMGIFCSVFAYFYLRGQVFREIRQMDNRTYIPIIRLRAKHPAGM